MSTKITSTSMYLFLLLSFLVISTFTHPTHRYIADLVFEPDFLWKKQDVTLAFLNGNEKEQLHFRRVYFQWFLPTHIHFKEVLLNRSADIRVGLGLDRHKSWSVIGSQSQFFSYDFSSKKVYRDYRKTRDPSLVVASNSNRHILHEGGHSIGLNHEHFHALANISWDKSFINRSSSLRLTPDRVMWNYLRTLPLNQSLGKFDR